MLEIIYKILNLNENELTENQQKFEELQCSICYNLLSKPIKL